MTRKDTILVAVLINAGLLIVLFATANKPSDSSMASKMEETTPFTSIDLPIHSEMKPEVSIDLMQANAKIDSEVRVEPREIEVIATPAIASEANVQTTPEIQLQPIHAGPQFKEHIVEKGQVLEKIARMHNTGVDAIMSANQLNSTQLKIGQVLKIPLQKSTNKMVSQALDKEQHDGSQAKYYIVKPGDSPWTIAVKNKIKVEDLLRLNQLDQNKAKKLKPGDKLRIQ